MDTCIMNDTMLNEERSNIVGWPNGNWMIDILNDTLLNEKTDIIEWWLNVNIEW